MTVLNMLLCLVLWFALRVVGCYGGREVQWGASRNLTTCLPPIGDRPFVVHEFVDSGSAVTPHNLCRDRRSGNLLDPPWGLQGVSESFPRSTHVVSWCTVAADKSCYPWARLAQSVIERPLKSSFFFQTRCSSNMLSTRGVSTRSKLPKLGT